MGSSVPRMTVFCDCRTVYYRYVYVYMYEEVIVSYVAFSVLGFVRAGRATRAKSNDQRPANRET